MNIKPKEMVQKHQKEIKEIIDGVKRSNNFLELLNLIYGTTIRALIIFIVGKYPSLTKMEIHKFLKAAGEKIAYANTVWNLDKLKKARILDYKKEKRYNTTLISIDIKGSEAYLKKTLKMYGSMPQKEMKAAIEAYKQGKKLK